MTSSIYSYEGTDLVSDIIKKFTSPEEWPNLQLVDKTFHTTISQYAQVRITQWEEDPSFMTSVAMAESLIAIADGLPVAIADGLPVATIAGFPPIRKIHSLYRLIADVRNDPAIKNDVLTNMPEAIKLKCERTLPLQDQVLDIAPLPNDFGLPPLQVLDMGQLPVFDLN
ncbi:MAG TPA: hypothetical protein VLE95_00430 [Chlamydiales bacterium]|nr:hypothetical protein [Chlamydiales bacterium]